MRHSLTPSSDSRRDRSSVLTVLPASPSLFVVVVEENLNPTLTSREPRACSSPPQPHAQACTLVELLISQACKGEGPWRLPIAGGSRVVALEPVAASTLAA